jgi:predicted RNA-binding Zn-ribbon protein involved in translation (DUF1610 family)
MNAEDIRRIGRMVERGATLRAVADTVGVSPTTVYRRLIAAGDPYPRRRRRGIGANDRRIILRLAMSGERSLNRIAGAVERSWHTVRRVIESEQVVRQTVRYRCPGCGYVVNIVPCQICRAQSALSEYTRRHNAATS